MSEKEDFLHLMVSETFEEQREEKSEECLISFDVKRKCYLINFNDKILEIPMNWSVFSRLEKEDLGYFVINSENFEHFLLVFNTYFKINAGTLIVKKIDGNIRLCINQPQGLIQNAA